MKKRLIAIIVSIIGIVFIVSISRSIYALSQKGNIVAEREKIRDSFQAENQKLQEELGYVQSPDFVEKSAREKLNLQREGEVVIVLPKPKETESPTIVKMEKLPSWQQWLKLFF